MLKKLPLLIIAISTLSSAYALPPDYFDRPSHAERRRGIIVAPGAAEALTQIGSNQWLTLSLHGLPGADVGTAPFGVRLQLMPSFMKNNHVYLAAEAMYEGRKVGGQNLFDVTDSIAGGLRLQIPVVKTGAKSALIVSPGIDILVAFQGDHESWFSGNTPYSDVYFIGTSADISWIHEFARHFALEAGIRVGADLSLGGKNGQNHETKGEIFPTFSIFGGTRF